jgi:predicted nucleotidyltransferase
MESRSEIIDKLKSFLKGKVDFAYLFGSAARDQLTPKSDIDCAVYIKNFTSEFKKIEFLYEINDFFDRPLDIIFLNDADIIITMQVLANGELIINDAPRATIEFKALKIGQYIDFKMSRKIIEDNLMNGRIYARK